MSNFNNSTYNININSSQNTININTDSSTASNVQNENTVPTSSQNSEHKDDNEQRNEISIWIDDTLPKLIKPYDKNNIYNADEACMFLDPLTRIRDIVTKDNKCLNGQYPRQRVTVLLCCNMDGTDKLPPLIIGYHDLSDSDNNNINNKNNNITYIKGNKAWMTKDIFVKWLQKLNKNMITEGKKIILFIDNAVVHLDLPTFENIKISMIPKKTTAIFQPLDLGIIKEFKRVHKKLVTDENAQLNATLTIKNVSEAWNAVSKATIEKGFVKFKKQLSTDEASSGKDDKWWHNIKNKLPSDILKEMYFEFDDNLAVCDTNIIGMIDKIKEIRSFYETYDNDNKEMTNLIEADLVTKTEEKQLSLKRKKQTLVSDYFNAKEKRC